METSSAANAMEPRFYHGLMRWAVMCRMIPSMGKYLGQKRKYPLFMFLPWKGGAFKTLEIMHTVGLRKVVRFNDSYYFALHAPRYPSKAFDNMVANGGLNVAVAGSPAKIQSDYVILALTRKCNLRCKHCYERFNLTQEDTVPVERWKEVIAELQKKGVSNIVLSGGEPMLRYDDVLELLPGACGRQPKAYSRSLPYCPSRRRHAGRTGPGQEQGPLADRALERTTRRPAVCRGSRLGLSPRISRRLRRA